MRRLLLVWSLAAVAWTGCASGNDSPVQIVTVTTAQTDPTKLTCDTTLPGITRSSATPVNVAAAALVTFWVQSDLTEVSGDGFGDTNPDGLGHNSFTIQQASYKYESSGISLADETTALLFVVPAQATAASTCFQELVLGNNALNTLESATVTTPTLVVSHITFKGTINSQSTGTAATNTVDFPFTLLPP